MAEVVVDASVLSALFLHEKGSEEIRNVVESGTTLYAPSFWRFEVSNAVWKAKEIPEKTARTLIEIIWHFPTDTNESEVVAAESLSIARRYGITFYDSFYIAMAQHLNVPLWTMDKVQSSTAIKAGAALWGLP